MSVFSSAPITYHHAQNPLAGLVGLPRIRFRSTFRWHPFKQPACGRSLQIYTTFGSRSPERVYGKMPSRAVLFACPWRRASLRSMPRLTSASPAGPVNGIRPKTAAKARPEQLGSDSTAVCVWTSGRNHQGECRRLMLLRPGCFGAVNGGICRWARKDSLIKMPDRGGRRG